MTTHDPHHEPLDSQERALARIVRALPGGEPPAALDAMILKASQDAVAAAPTRRTSRWLAGGAVWGIGSAAAAVLAIGVGWQVLNPSPATHLPMPTRAPTQSTPAPDSANEDAAGTTVEFRDQPPRAYDNSPPPAPAETTAPMVRTRTRADAFPGSPPPAPATEPAPPPVPMAAAAPVTAQATGSVDGFARARVESSGILNADQGPKADKAQASSNSASAKPSDSVIVSGSLSEYASSRAQQTEPEREAQSASSNSAKAELDFRGRPVTWLAHIRRLRDDGDVANARASLGEFRKRFPDFAVPSDLLVLMDP